MDALWWEPNWIGAGSTVFRHRADEVTRGDQWVLDGNYFSQGARDVVWPRADTIVWLDQPRWVTVPRVIRRTLSRAVHRTALWSGNRESLGCALGAGSIIRYAWREHPNYARCYGGLDAHPAYAHLDWVRLNGRRAVRRWLRTIG
jgi:hypothetical protein